MVSTRWIRIAVAMIVGVLLVSCAAPPPSPTAVPSAPQAAAPAPTSAAVASPAATKEEWVISTSDNPATNIDPMGPRAGGANNPVKNLLFSGLIHQVGTLAADGTISWALKPNLAESWQTVDPTHWRFTLKKGIKFQNGQELTIDDVKYSCDAVLASPKSSAYMYMGANVAGCKVVSSNMIEFELKAPDAAFLDVLWHFLISPKSRGTTQAEIDAFNANPVGSGPYKLARSFEKDRPVYLEAWSGHYGGLAKPKRVTFKYIQEATTRMAALMSGEVDMIENPVISQIPVLTTNKDMALVTVKGSQVIPYLMNFFKPPFNDLRVRQAVNYAVDRNAIVNNIMQGYGMVATSYLWKGMQGGEIDRRPYPYDPAKARQLLAEAGYPNGFETTLYATSGTYIKDAEIAQAIQGYLAQVGIKVKVQVSDITTMTGIYRAGNFDMFQTYWNLSVRSPFSPLRWVLLQYGQEQALNNPPVPKEITEIRALATQASITADEKERTALYAKVNTMIYDQATALFTHVEAKNYAYNKARLGDLKLKWLWSLIIPMYFDTTSLPMFK